MALLELPNDKSLRRFVRRLERRAGVSGVGWGLRRDGDGWSDEIGLSVHVRSPGGEPSWSAKARTRKRIAGFDIEVLPVADPATQAIDCTDPVIAPDQGHSTPTVCVRTSDGHGLGLVSGHGCLPFTAGRMVRRYDDAGHNGHVIVIDDGGHRCSGRLLAGSCGAGGRVDWGVVRFESGEDVDVGHGTAGATAPLRWRSTPLAAGEALYHHSRARRALKRGLAVQITSERLRMPDGGYDLYRGIAMVAWDDADGFSVASDSGSLVIDMNNRAIGAVLGGSARDRCSYVVLLSYLAALPRARTRFQEFFR